METFALYLSDQALIISSNDKILTSINRTTLQQVKLKPSENYLKISFLFILGLYKYETINNNSYYFLVIITKTKPCNFFDIYQIQSFEIIPLSNDPLNSNTRKFIELLKLGLNHCPMYFSDTYNLTLTFPQQFENRQSRQFFIWNSKPISYLNQFFPALKCYKEVISGYIHKIYPFIIITRKSNRNGGCHSWNRGCDEDGNSANFLENEEIMITCDKSDKLDQISAVSHIEISGSCPFLWTVYPTMKSNREFHFGPTEESERRFNKHFDNLKKHYIDKKHQNENNEISNISDEKEMLNKNENKEMTNKNDEKEMTNKSENNEVSNKNDEKEMTNKSENKEMTNINNEKEMTNISESKEMLDKSENNGPENDNKSENNEISNKSGNNETENENKNENNKHGSDFSATDHLHKKSHNHHHQIHDLVIISLLNTGGKELELSKVYKSMVTKRGLRYHHVKFNQLVRKKGDLIKKIDRSLKDYIEASIINEGKVLKKQRKIQRINCSSCLDRTSVFMEVMFGKVFEKYDHLLFENNKQSHQHLWYLRANKISEEYALTKGLKTYLIFNDYCKNFHGKMSDKVILLKRYLCGIFSEGKYCDAYNAVLQEKKFTEFDDSNVFMKIFSFIQLILLFIFLFFFKDRKIATKTWDKRIKMIINHPHTFDLRDANEFNDTEFNKEIDH